METYEYMCICAMVKFNNGKMVKPTIYGRMW